jgi:CheY-like chemotaxis protein
VIATSSSPSGAAPNKVLVVDDDEMMRDLLRRMLERAGFAVVTATNGRDGLERFRESRVDVAITDMKMPEMDGAELMRALLIERPGMAIIAISGAEHSERYLYAARALGAKAVLRKPLASAELVQTLERVLAAH